MIDTTNAAAAVTVEFNAAGTVYFEAAFVDSSGTARQSFSGTLASVGTPNSARIIFPQFSTAGTWTLSRIFLSDNAGNTSILDSDALIRRGFPTQLEVKSIKDTVSPRLIVLAISPAEIDTSAGPAEVKVNYNANDDVSGVTYIELSFASPSGARRGGSAKFEPSRSVANIIAVTFPRFSEAGRWTLSSVFLADAAGNTSVLDDENLGRLGFPASIDVRSSVDTVSPKLGSLSFTPEMIDTSEGPKSVKVDFTATDDLSGVNSIEVVFVSPSGSTKRSASTAFPPATSVANSVYVSFPHLSEPGQWILERTALADAAGNTLILSPDEMAGLGLHSLQVGSKPDTAPPDLISIRLAPDKIDTSHGPAKVRVEFTAADDLSGVKALEVVFTNPTGTLGLRGAAAFTPATGVSGSVEVTFPQSSEAGFWSIASLVITDAAGNSRILDQDVIAAKGITVR